MTLDGQNEDYKTAVKTIVLDGPDIGIQVRLHCDMCSYRALMFLCLVHGAQQFLLKLNTSLQVLGETRVNQPLVVELTMLNTLPEKLQDCVFILQGSGLVDGRIEARFVCNLPNSRRKPLEIHQKI